MYSEKTITTEQGQAAIRAKKQELVIRSLEAVIVLVSLIFACVSFGVTRAWFGHNTETDNTMLMQSTTTSNLVIADNTTDIQTAVWLETSVDLSDDAVPIKPATHDAAADDWEAAEGTYLKWNTNPGIVSKTTGYATSGSLTFAEVPVFTGDTDETRYYYDFVVYIASAGSSFTAQELNASISYNGTLADAEDYVNATSVDFYVGGVEAANYKGTLNLAGKNHTNNGAAVTTVDLTGEATIPHNVEGYLTVTMRFYIDGNLQKSAGQAYVYSENLTTEDFDVSVAFSAVE